MVKVKTSCQLTCPECGNVSMETMPIDACIYFFECLHCQAMGQTLYRRPLPPDAIAFSSADGREVFAEALATHMVDERHTPSQ
jgi:hypothetical protein